jgi:hypothetical protein
MELMRIAHKRLLQTVILPLEWPKNDNEPVSAMVKNWAARQAWNKMPVAGYPSGRG